MRYQYKRILVGLLAGTMLLQGMNLSAAETDSAETGDAATEAVDGEAATEGEESAVNTVNANYISRTEDEVFASMEKVASADGLELYFTLDQKYEYNYATLELEYDPDAEEEEYDEDEYASDVDIYTQVGFNVASLREVTEHSGDVEGDVRVFEVMDITGAEPVTDSWFYFYEKADDYAENTLEIPADAAWTKTDDTLKMVAWGFGEEVDTEYYGGCIDKYVATLKAQEAVEQLYDAADDYITKYDKEETLDDGTAKLAPANSVGVIGLITDEEISSVSDTASFEEAISLELGEEFEGTVWGVELDEDGELYGVYWAESSQSTVIAFYDDDDGTTDLATWTEVEAHLGAALSAPVEGDAYDGELLTIDDMAITQIVDCGNPSELFALKDTVSGEIWWSAPVNAEADIKGSKAYRNNLMSGIAVTIGVPSARKTETMSSVHKGSLKTPETINNGVKLTYLFDYKVGDSTVNFEIPVQYTLENGSFNVKIVTEEIVESNTTTTNGAVIMDIEVFSGFGAGAADEEGYFIIPDGSGAVIDFNNGKTKAKAYSAKVYGSDITAVPLFMPDNTETVSFPMFGIVKQDTAMLAVVSQGDSSVTINAAVSMATKSTSYNTCSFTFNLRDSDSYYMSSSSVLEVFETRDINTPVLEVKYTPVNGDGNVDYVDVAAAYREYLIESGEITVKATENYAPMYVNLFGGTTSVESVMGIPVNTRLDVTSFDQAQTILEALDGQSIDNIVVSYNNWTNAAIDGEIDFKAKPSSALGGKSAYNDLLDYIASKNIQLYNVVDNVYFNTGNGYWTFTDTAMRISGEYARLYDYEFAFGTAVTEEDSVSLITPAVFDELYKDLAQEYKDEGVSGVSLGSLTQVLYGDYAKDFYTRYDTQLLVEQALSDVRASVGNVISDTPNQYAIGYSDQLTSIPLSSSKYDIFDYDIPFYQLVMHGVVPYSCASINSDADSEEAFLRAIATGSNLQYDMVYIETNELKATDYDVYYYANYEYWLETAGEEYAIAKEILPAVSNANITDYVEENGVITTTYSNGVSTVVDINNGTIECNGKSYALENYN